MSSEKLTPLSEIGEFGFINELSDWCGDYGKAENLHLGIGDDCAVLDFDEKHFQLVSTDMLTEGVHFDLSYTPLMHLGFKAVASNVSDIYAMNATPESLVVALGISSKYTYEAVRELYTGIVTACKTYGVTLIGGDTTSSKVGMTISITVMGKVEKDKLATRSGAKDKDLLLVSGDLGGAYMGLQVLEREKAVFKSAPTVQPVLDNADYVLKRQLRPEARRDIVEDLAAIGVVPTSMIDVSDGVSSEVMHLSQKSGVSFAIYDEKLPIDPQTRDLALEFNLDPSTAALNGGEDYELLFTIKQSDFDKLKDSPNYSVIGYAQPLQDGNVLIDSNGKQHDIKAQGWNAFTEDKL